MIEHAYQYNLAILVLMVGVLLTVLWQMRTVIYKHFNDAAHTITYIAYRDHVVVNIDSGLVKEFGHAQILTTIRKALNWKHLELTDAAVKQLEWWLENEVKEKAQYTQGCMCMLKTPGRYHTGYTIEIRSEQGEVVSNIIELPHDTQTVVYGSNMEFATLGVAHTLIALVTGKGLWSTYLDEVWGLDHRIYAVLNPAVKKYHLANTLGTIFFSTVVLAGALTWLYDGSYWPMVLFAIWFAALCQFSGGNMLSTLADRIDDSWVHSRYPDTDLVLAAEAPSRKATQRFTMFLITFLAALVATVATAGAPATNAGVIGMTLTTIVLGSSAAGFLAYFKEFMEITERLDRLHYARKLGLEDCNHVI